MFVVDWVDFVGGVNDNLRYPGEAMSDAQRIELQGLVEGLVAGYMLDCNKEDRGTIPRKSIIEVSRNAGRYVGGQLKEVVVTK